MNVCVDSWQQFVLAKSVKPTDASAVGQSSCIVKMNYSTKTASGESSTLIATAKANAHAVDV